MIHCFTSVIFALHHSVDAKHSEEILRLGSATEGPNSTSPSSPPLPLVKAFCAFREETGRFSDEEFAGALERIYLVFDVNEDGEVDFNELLCGLSILCGGEEEEKIETAFALFDQEWNRACDTQ